MWKKITKIGLIVAFLFTTMGMTQLKAEEENTENKTVQENAGFSTEEGPNGYEDWIPDYVPKGREMYGGYSRNGKFIVVNMNNNQTYEASNLSVYWKTGGVGKRLYIPSINQTVDEANNYAYREYIEANGSFVLKRNCNTFTVPIFNSRFITSEVLPAGTYTVVKQALEFVQLQKSNGQLVWVAPQYYNDERFIASNQGYFTESKGTLSVNSVNGKPIKQRMMPIREDKRTGIAMQPKYVTIHNTASFGNGANAAAHANLQINDSRKWISWHYSVDNNEIYQSMPMNEVGYHAGDGQNIGNSSTIGIEICENADGNYAQAERNAAYLTAQILYENNLPSDAVRLHKDWSGKNCAHNIIEGTKGTMGWGTFKNLVRQEYDRLAALDAIDETVFAVNYRTHVQSLGWQGYKKDGVTSGTSGRKLRLEAIKMKISKNDFGGGIEYSTHVQSEGWQKPVRDNELSGTSGRGLRLEAIKVDLYGGIKEQYDVYYRVHAQSLGWLDWAKNGESAGTAGMRYRLEAIEVRLVKKDGPAPGNTANPFANGKVNYRTHVQTVGWQDVKKSGDVAGTTGRKLRLEGIQINKVDDIAGDINYRTHVQTIGWQPFVKNGQMSGTSGRALRLEAIEISLTGDLANVYDVYYRVHSQTFGWLGWAKNGQASGTAGYGFRLEGIQIVFVEKGGPAPGPTTNTFRQK